MAKKTRRRPYQDPTSTLVGAMTPLVYVVTYAILVLLK